jgi:SAM-dependent methyltransferase
MESVWEELISLNARGAESIDVLGPAAQYRATDADPTDWSGEGQALEDALARDTLPLPKTEDREGYFGPNHFSYWASGHRDWRLIREAAARLNVPVRDYLDFGCASGRVIRHAALDPTTERVFGCDINRRHTDWIAQHLPNKVVAFQNHSIPNLPLPDACLDVVSAYSVFTHIEVFETAWLMELRRILRPGGIAWLTVQTELTWNAMTPDWPVYDALKHFEDFAAIAANRSELPSPRTVYRWRGDRSYSSHVFYSRKYLRETWARIMPIVEEHHMLPSFQDVVILQKPR